MAGNRALGLGLLVGGLALLGLLLVWLAVSGSTSGGIVLGLILALVLAGPLIGGGAYVLSRQKVEQSEAAAFASKRRILESDRLFRDELATTLRSLDARPELRDLRVRELADDLAADYRRGAAWEDSIQLDDASLEMLRRYDDLVRERARVLRDGAPNASTAVAGLREAIDQREDLLRGRRPPSLAPSELLRSGSPRTGASALEELKLGDAVSHDGVDYTVDAVADYFDQGERWKLVRLEATSGETEPRWLYVGQRGLEVGLLSETTPTDSSGGTAVVNVDARVGKAEGVLVEYSRERDGAQVRLEERWPDGARHAYNGPLMDADDIDVWPAFTPE